MSGERAIPRHAMQYVAICPGCQHTIALKRDQIERGRNPDCGQCGTAMVVYSATPGARIRHGDSPVKGADAER